MTDKHKKANHRVVVKSILVTALMFGFGYALVPFYNLMCQAFGLNGQVERITEASLKQAPVDKSRLITVRFDANTNSRLPWKFLPQQRSVQIHPGEATRAMYKAQNLSGSDVVGQATYSVTPPEAARHFKKTDCFCFTQQRLQSGEEKDMPVLFVIDAELPKEINTVTLSYTFLRADEYAEKKTPEVSSDSAARPAL